jgi:acyl-CoA hydrolase
MALLEGNDYRIFAEMFSSGVLTLWERNKLDLNSAVVGSFVFGTDELYKWLDHNRHINMRRIGWVNDPARIAQQRNMTGINTAMQVDLRGQANAAYAHGDIYSGFGGQPDFHNGAQHAPRGKAIMALRSWHPKANVSTIVPRLTEQTTTMQPSYVVTEFGIARILGECEADQAESLIGIADPRARVELARVHFNRPSIIAA